MKKTKIVCTIGPASDSMEMMEKLFLTGMNVVRVNMSHGSFEEHGPKITNARAISKKHNKPLAVLLDTKGPEIRTHFMKDGKINLKTGQKLTISMEEVLGTEEKISVTYTNLVNDVEIGSKILIDDGLIETIVVEKKGNELIVEVKNDGELIDRRGINVPGAILNFDFISPLDKEHMEWGVDQGIDFIAASFVRRESDVLEVRELLKRKNAENVKIISKIESVEAVEKFEEILEASDGIMVARGDMGVELPFEELPAIQKMIIRRCNEVGKPVITATQMLESMKKNPRPTRAEVTDVANAIYDGTGAIMLSAESANGKYPQEAVETMYKIATKTESLLEFNENFIDVSETDSVTEAVSLAASEMADVLDASAIIALTKSGNTANKIAKYRNRCPLIAVTDDVKVYNQLGLTWGVIPMLAESKNNTDEIVAQGIAKASETGLVEKGDKVVITGGVQANAAGTTNMIKVHVM